MMETVRKCGDPTWVDDHLLPVDRNGYLEVLLQCFGAIISIKLICVAGGLLHILIQSNILGRWLYWWSLYCCV